MKTTRNALLCSLVIGFGLAQNGIAGQDPAAIAEAEIARLQQALDAGDLDALMQFYGEDAVVLPPTDETLTHPAAIRAFWRRRADSLRHFDVDWVRCEQTGDTIYSAGVWSATRNGGDSGESGEYTGGNVVTVFTRQPDGTWKTTLQTWN